MNWSPSEIQLRAWALDCDLGGFREISDAAIECPGDAGGAAADEGLGRVVGRADRHIGVALGQVQRLVAEQDVEPDIGALPEEGGEDRRQQIDQQRVVGGDAQFAGGLDLLPGEPAGKGGDVLVDALGKRRHLVAGGRRDIAAAMALEQLEAERLLDLPEPAEHRRMVQSEHRGGGR